jgi:hypothetical protein
MIVKEVGFILIGTTSAFVSLQLSFSTAVNSLLFTDSWFLSGALV